jgi:hypothetical protein
MLPDMNQLLRELARRPLDQELPKPLPRPANDARPAEPRTQVGYILAHHYETHLRRPL